MYNQYMLDSLTRQKDRIDEMIKSYQQPITTNNFISSNQMPASDNVLWRVLNENEEVDNLYVNQKTLFINDKNMVLKGVDGSLEKWEVKKIYPVDEKDKKIHDLEEEVKRLKEVIDNEYSKPDKSIRNSKQSDTIIDVDVESKSKTNNKYISKEK